MGNDDEKRVVWILGAGFSVPLGGPLFKDLISARTLRRLKTWEEFVKQDVMLNVPRPDTPGASEGHFINVFPLATIVEHLYRAGTAETTRLWEDAEQFLDVLEIASHERDAVLAGEIHAFLDQVGSGLHDESDKRAIRAFKGPDGIGTLHREAVRSVAAACTIFLRRFQEEASSVVLKSELWAPYRRWAVKLKPTDSIVTFNYDRVLDLLNGYLGHVNKSKPRDRFLLDSPVGDPEFLDATRDSTIPMYHLHGHVGWLARDYGGIDTGVVEKAGVPITIARAHQQPDKAVLGLPGRFKSEMPDGILKCVWEPAMDAIANATSVVFVGYRFPETDNYAKQRLVDALRQNPEATVHIVLGANNLDTPRLKGMIHFARQSYDTVQTWVHELKAQDFFAVFERRRL